jgi:DNA-binding transcriptional LysR family regulator
MELRALRSLVAVSDEGGFARAATRLGISQPTVSGHIKDLERSLGVALLDRRTRPVRLTAAGDLFIRHARIVLTEVDASVDAIRSQVRGRTGGVVRIGTYASATCGYLPYVLDIASRELPEVAIVLHEMTGIEMEAAAEARGVDIFLRQAELPQEELLEPSSLERAVIPGGSSCEARGERNSIFAFLHLHMKRAWSKIRFRYHAIDAN